MFLVVSVFLVVLVVLLSEIQLLQVLQPTTKTLNSGNFRLVLDFNLYSKIGLNLFVSLSKRLLLISVTKNLNISYVLNIGMTDRPTKRVIVYLLNGFRYVGHIISSKDQLIDFYDEKIQDSILINKNSIRTIEPIKEEKLHG